MVTNTPHPDPIARRALLVAIAVAVAVLAYLLAAIIGPVLGTDAIWPFDRIGLVLVALAGAEAVANRMSAEAK